jgi:hypothetical protein
MGKAYSSTSLLHFYKAYHLDRTEGIAETSLIMAANDAAALSQAVTLCKGRDIEVWDRSRFVGRVSAQAALGQPTLDAHIVGSLPSDGRPRALNA